MKITSLCPSLGAVPRINTRAIGKRHSCGSRSLHQGFRPACPSHSKPQVCPCFGALSEHHLFFGASLPDALQTYLLFSIYLLTYLRQKRRDQELPSTDSFPECLRWLEWGTLGFLLLPPTVCVGRKLVSGAGTRYQTQTQAS